MHIKYILEGAKDTWIHKYINTQYETRSPDTYASYQPNIEVSITVTNMLRTGAKWRPWKTPELKFGLPILEIFSKKRPLFLLFRLRFRVIWSRDCFCVISVCSTISRHLPLPSWQALSRRLISRPMMSVGYSIDISMGTNYIWHASRIY